MALASHVGLCLNMNNIKVYKYEIWKKSLQGTTVHLIKSSGGAFFFGFISLLPHDTLPHFPCPPPPPSSGPPTSSSPLLLLPRLQRRGTPVVCVTVDPREEDRSNISSQCTEAFRPGIADMMIGADGRMGAPGVLKSVTDSDGFDSPPLL